MGEAEEKAEKLAAAKKKYEQLKKQKAKKGGAKKKDDKSEAEAEASTPNVAEEDVKEDADDGTVEATPTHDEDESPRPHGRHPSMSIQSKLRSESFRNSDSPLSPGVADLEGLERENKRLQAEVEEAQSKWHQLEDELQELREADGDAAGLKVTAVRSDQHAAELEKLKAEISSLQRQNNQLAAAKRRTSASISIAPSSSEDLTAQLNSKAETISTLELEISTLHSKLSTAQTATDLASSKISSLELELEKITHSAESTAQELADLKANLDKGAAEDGTARTSAESRIAQLEAELGTAQRAASTASTRASTQEKKVETLTTLHRESDARSQAKLVESGKAERDAKELRSRVTSLSNENARLRDEAIRRKKLEAAGDSGGLEELEDEERLHLASRVRELEEEVFELRRGVWRDKRSLLQPGIDDVGAFDDVDLTGASSPTGRRQEKHSTLQDVIASGLSAFRGDAKTGGGRDRNQSLGLMDDDDFAFDEDAFKKAQEDEGRVRLERVREVKRGLGGWKGWRVDIAEVRMGWGGVFEA